MNSRARVHMDDDDYGWAFPRPKLTAKELEERRQAIEHADHLEHLRRLKQIRDDG